MRTTTWLGLGLACAATVGCAALFHADDPAQTRNSFYPSHREPLLPQAFVKLPAGSIEPRGWLRKQLELQAAGFHGRLTEISPFLRREGNAWLSKDGQGDRGWEEVPYWLKGYIGCAFALNDQRMIDEARVWIEGALASQDATGMFGPRGKGATSTVQSTSGPLDLWANMVMLNCLQTWHEATGDARVLELMRKYFAFELTIPDDQFLPPYWQQQRAADNLASVLWLHDRTGDPQLLELAHKIHRHTANWTDGVPDWHNVNMSEAFGGPTTYWPLSKDAKHRDAAERNFRTIREQYGQVPGGMFGGDENCRPGFADPRQAIETCGMVEMMLSCERLFAITGDPVWAERCEDVAYNSLPAAFMPDYSGLRYLTAPNMVQSDASPKAPELQNGGNMFEMRCDDHRCCQHNAGHGWPYFAEHVWMATPDDGLALVFPVASRVKAKVRGGVEVTLEVESHYPFLTPTECEVVVRVRSTRAVEFPLWIRKPSWAGPTSIRFASESGTMRSFALEESDGFTILRQRFEAGDVVRIQMLPQTATRTWPGNHDSVSVDYGPLTYSLLIGEEYRKSSEHALFPGHEIFPRLPWNYGLELDRHGELSQQFELEMRAWPADDQPFVVNQVPVILKARAARIPEWTTDGLGLVGLLQRSPAGTNEPSEVVRLVPMGAARLRIAAFPTVSRHSPRWVKPPAAVLAIVRVSHCNASDTPLAVADGVLPSSPADTSIPRFTWWDHQGTSEWIEREIPYRKVAATRVFWFDDSATGGGCRVPKSVRVMVRWNGQWRPVDGSTSATDAKAGWSSISFTPVDTDALRLEVQLEDGASAGILEWEIPESSGATWEQRWHPLREEWVILAAHRQHRPWIGATHAPTAATRPTYVADCTFCPRNTRVSGATNPAYTSTFVFDNDHPCVGDTSPAIEAPRSALYRNGRADGIARVLCYSPRHDLTLAEMSVDAIGEVVRVWQRQTQDVGKRSEVRHVLLFENKGELVGVSNPHPHGQLYATNFVWKTVEVELAAMAKHRATTGLGFFADIIAAEREDGRRVLFEDEHAIAFVPYFARYAYEVYVAPKRRVPHVHRLNDAEVASLARALKDVTVRFDNLWKTSFPYVMPLHQAPCDGSGDADFHFFIGFLPPLRQPNLLKFLAGPEIGGGNFLSDTSPEDKAAELRAQSTTHWRASSADGSTT